VLAPREEHDASTASGRGIVAVRAGTIHLVEDGRVLRDGVILIKDGKIQALGEGLELPFDTTVIDYGKDAVIVPGLVAAMSPYALGSSSRRTADPTLSALDAFDGYRDYVDGLSGGVTSAYLAPADNRLIAGVGAVVKLGGEKEAGRVLSANAAIHGAIDAAARSVPGYWDPPIPAAPDQELGYMRSQLPRTAIGAIVALEELLDGTSRPDDPALAEEYGRRTAGELGKLLANKVPLRLGASEPSEIRALLDLVARRHLPLVIDRAEGAREVAAEIAAAGLPVIFRVPYYPNSGATDRGKGQDARWLELDVPAALVRAGARVAITAWSTRDLLFAARFASRGGLEPAAALRAITLAPAEMLGVAARVGSLREGKDADLCVLNGDPLAPGASVLATWIDGALVWKAKADGRATVLEVDELHVGDGRVLRPGQLLLHDGKIREVGERVSHPAGAIVVRGWSAMPGMIDALGHLGLEGSRRMVSADFELASIVEPGDEVDRRVALEGITTVALSPRGANESGAPMMAYKPAASQTEGQVIGDPIAVRLRWEDQSRPHNGQNVRALLERAAEYRGKWLEYEAAMAKWTPPATGTEPEKKDDEKAEEKKEGDSTEKGEEKKDEKAAEEKKDEPKKDEGATEKSEKKEDSKSKKKKKGEPEELEPDPVTGQWQGELTVGETKHVLKLRTKLAKAGESGKVEGNLRCDAASSSLVTIEGWFDREKRTLTLKGIGTNGRIEFTGELKEGKLAGKLAVGGKEHEVTLERKSKEYVVARRSDSSEEKEPEAAPEPKGKPKEPRRDAKLEPLRRAMDGSSAVVIEVDRASDIVACVETFAHFGIHPILYGAREAHLVVDELVGRVAGVFLLPTVVGYDQKRGTDYPTPYADLQNAGLRVAFLSEAEEGAIDLPLRAAYAVANGMSPDGAVRALTADAADMLAIGARVGRLAAGLDGDVLLLDGPPLEPETSVVRAWVNGEEVEAP
jgi:imidazolonepropionase-like amidohydrolase